MKDTVNECIVGNLLDLSKTAAREIFSGAQYPWEVLSEIKGFIIKLGSALSEEIFEKRGDDIWIAKNAKIYPSAYIEGPCIIDENAEIRHCAFIRGSVIVGKNAVVGNSTELKNCILFDNVQVPHYNYVGDSILGYKAHLGAGALTSNVKSDKTNVAVKNLPDDKKIETGFRKFGAIVGDNTEVGCGAVLCPGTVLGRECIIYPLSGVRGYVPEKHIFKNPEHIIERK